jgi:hypothetical protein
MLALLAALSPGSPPHASGSEERKDENPGVLAGVENGKIIMSAKLSSAITADAMKAISGGTPVTFTYVAQVMMKRWALWDKTLRQVVIKRMVKYDALKKTFLVWEKRGESEKNIGFGEELKKVEYKPAEPPPAPDAGAAEKKPPSPAPEKAGAPVVMDPLELAKPHELEEWMASTGKLDLGSAEGIGEADKYYVQARLKVKSVNPSPPLRFLLFFYSFLDLDTGWIASEPFSAPAREKEPASPPPPQPAPGGRPQEGAEGAK